MTQPKYPNVEALGAKVEYTDAHLEPPTAVVRAAELERILAQAPEVRANLSVDNGKWILAGGLSDATHTARLVCARRGDER